MNTERVTFDLPPWLLTELDSYARRIANSRAAVMRMALINYLQLKPSDMDENGE
jgi:metal-responsive CopG/Arc/MetJ family transcriptional regulator